MMPPSAAHTKKGILRYAGRLTLRSRRVLSSSTTKQEAVHTSKQKYPHQHQHQHRLAIFKSTAGLAIGASVYTRYVREQKLSTLILAQESGLLGTTSIAKSESSAGPSERIIPPQPTPKYDLPSLIETVRRAGLIGSTKSVKVRY